MRKINENELTRATGILQEYIRTIEQAVPPAPPSIGVSGTPNTGRLSVNVPPALTLDPTAAKVDGTAIGQLQSAINAATDPAKKAELQSQLTSLQRTLHGSKMVTQAPVAGATPTAQSATPTVAATAKQVAAGPMPAQADMLAAQTAGMGDSQADMLAAQTTGMDSTKNTKAATTQATKSEPKANPAILKLQKELIAKGANIKADGIMGPKTQAAMAQFQQRSTTPAAQPAPRLAAQPTTPAAQPAPRPDTVSQAMGSFATESVRYGEDPTLARIVGLAGL